MVLLCFILLLYCQFLIYSCDPFHPNSAGLLLQVTSWSRHRADSRLAPSQWETSLRSNAVSNWLGANLESAKVQQSMDHVHCSLDILCHCDIPPGFCHVCRLCVIYVGEDNDFNAQAMITRLMWTIWTSLSAVRERPLNLITHSLLPCLTIHKWIIPISATSNKEWFIIFPAWLEYV